MPLIGANASLYYAGTDGAWSRVDNVRDLNVTIEAPTYDETPADTTGRRANGSGPLEAAITWGMVWDASDPALQFILAAFLAGDRVDLFAIDGGDISEAEASGAGMWLPCEILAFTPSQPIDDIISVAITAKPTICDDVPAWLSPLIDIDNGEIVYDIDASQIVMAA